MREDSERPWMRHFVYRSEHLRTTWKLRIGLVALVATSLWLTSGWWTAAVARSLVCEPNVAPSDAILIENFDPDYLLFERARQLRQEGVAPRILVPVATSDGSGDPNAVGRGIAELMAGIGRVGPVEIIPIRELEPISLNAARDIRNFAAREGIRSVIVVSPLFRSRRSSLIYHATLDPAGITVRCEAVGRPRDAESWPKTWHGIQNAAEQWLKLQYYRWYVLPLRAN